MTSAPTVYRQIVFRLVLFGIVFAIGTALHFFFRTELAPFVNGTMNARASASVINLMSHPRDRVRVRRGVLATRTHSMEVAQGCEGVDVILMVLSALVATPMCWRRRLLGMLAGTLVIYACNLLRITGLWYTLLHWPDSFGAMHVIVGQTAIILVGVTFFVAWTTHRAPRSA